VFDNGLAHGFNPKLHGRFIYPTLSNGRRLGLLIVRERGDSLQYIEQDVVVRAEGHTAFHRTGENAMVRAEARPRDWMARGRGGRVLMAALSCHALAMGFCAARGDTIVLRGGGQVQGKVVPDPEHNDRVQVWLLQGRKPLSFEKSRIVEVIKSPSPLDEYVTRRAKVPETAQGQYELGVWCEQNKLMDLARLHFEAALEFDKSLESAHRKLGHVFHAGHWLSRDELSKVQGLVKHKGRWISKEEKAKLEEEEESTAAQGNWLRQIKLLRKSILGGSADRRREAEAQLMAIRDPDAVVPLVRVFGGDDKPLRILMIQVISMIQGPVGTAALVKQVLAESDPDVRAVVSDHLKMREDPSAVPRLVRALSSSDVKVINRAAWMLGNLGAVEAVPKLITVLTTTETHVVIVTPDQQNPGPMFGTISGPGMPVAPLRVTNGGAALLTSPVVGQGVAAYGAMAFPWYQLPANLGINVGGQIDQRPDAKLATFTFHNVEVLGALEKLTGQNFEYHFEAWRNWVSRSFNPNPKPKRRVPQP
jgi:hypothetical protein